jgi:gas vesicle protein
MGFYGGLIIGVLVGANIGIMVTGLLAASKRAEPRQDYLWDQLHMDQAVMDETPEETQRAAGRLPGASADPNPIA